jgi:hypothetical protein
MLYPVTLPVEAVHDKLIWEEDTAKAVNPVGTLGGVVLVWTVKPTPLLATPPTVTTTLPVVAPLGTVAVMLAALQLAAVAAVPLKVTVLVTCVAPKLAPTIVTDVPTNPDTGFRLVMLGTAVTVLLTFTAIPGLVAVIPAVSVAAAVRVWFPLESALVFSE